VSARSPCRRHRERPAAHVEQLHLRDRPGGQDQHLGLVVGEWDSINQQLRLYVNSGSRGSGLIGQTRRFFTGMVSNPVLVPGVADQTQIGLMSGTQVVGLP
jgi:hypothetical protein